MSVEQIAYDAKQSPAGSNILEFRSLSLEYRVRGRDHHRVLDDVSFDVPRGAMLALVGESGSGKSTLARTVTGTLASNAHITAGSVRLDGRELTDLSQRRYERLRGSEFGYVPQDALLGLNPLLPVGKQAGEPLRVHSDLSAQQRRERVLELFDLVGLRRVEQVFDSYPHELSGGMCQRVLIAAAIAAEPKLIIADEPTTALDVTVQKKILDLLVSLTESQGLSVLLVTHDLGIAADRAENLVVLRQGKLVEKGPTQRLVTAPAEAYTRSLIDASHLGASAIDLAEQRERRIRNRDAASRIQEAPVVLAEGLFKTFKSRTGEVVALDNVSLSVPSGTTVGIVGESGSGKTTLARSIAGLVQPDAGDITVRGVRVGEVAKKARERRSLYRHLQFVYQNAYAALNPRHTVRRILEEPLTGYRLGSAKERRRRVDELLDVTGLSSALADRFTAELSGGQRQRVAIARALAPYPEVLICDEPVSALDVTVQRQILDLLVDLQQEFGLTYLFVSHDLAVVSEISDQIVVMQHGSIVESGPAAQLLRHPQTDYVRDLLAAIPGSEPSEFVNRELHDHTHHEQAHHAQGNAQKG